MDAFGVDVMYHGQLRRVLVPIMKAPVDWPAAKEVKVTMIEIETLFN